MKRIALMIASLLAAGAFPLLAETAVKRQPSGLTFEKQSVTATGITPRGRAILFGVQHAFISYTNVITKIALLQTDQQGTGSVTWRLNEEAAPFSLWAVVDMETGVVRFSGPPVLNGIESPAYFSAVGQPSRALEGEAGSTHLTRLGLNARTADVLWIRPGKGAWRVEAFDGGGVDVDHKSNGRITLEPGSMSAVGVFGAPPTEFAPGDVIVVIDPQALHYFSIEVPK